MSAVFPTRTLTVRVEEANRLSETGYELVLERRTLDFLPGMVVTIHGRDATEDREYSIASGVHDAHLRILYRYIPNGRLTSSLVRLRAGDSLEISGPFGQFVIRDPARPLVFIATGTGIAPCRSFVRSFPDLDLTVIHGVRASDDLFYAEEFAGCAYHPCVSRTARNGREGRVTDLLLAHPVPAHAHVYLCGAYGMIFDVGNLLAGQGIPRDSIFSEAYYYSGP